MAFLSYFKTKKAEMNRLDTEKKRLQDAIRAAEAQLQATDTQLVGLNIKLAAYRDCDIEKNKSIVNEIFSISEKIKTIAQKCSNISDQITALKANHQATKNESAIMALEGVWYSLQTERRTLQTEKESKSQNIAVFRKLCQATQSSDEDMTEPRRQAYLERFTQEIELCTTSQTKLHNDLQTLRSAETAITQQLSASKKDLAKQYRKAAYLLLGLATGGIALSCVLAAMYSTMALYILILSAVTVGVTLRQGYAFFQEGKTHDANLTWAPCCSR